MYSDREVERKMKEIDTKLNNKPSNVKTKIDIMSEITDLEKIWKLIF